MEIDINELKGFLIKAKKATYANGDVEKVASSRRGSSDYEYRDGKFVYHDTYFGGVQFAGEEVVYIDGQDKPIWAMNYFGETIDRTLSEEMMDKILRPALMRVGEDDILPVRGPKKFKNKGFHYYFTVDGDMERFNGVEQIFENKEKRVIFRLYCSGGTIV